VKNLLIHIIIIISAHAVMAQENSTPGTTSNQNAKSKNYRKHPDYKTKIHYGTASFYANKFEGKQTANGEIFSQKKLTAASNIIRLNEWVRVTNIHNNMSVIVRITDRMHRNNKRLIDLSRAAAKKLRYTGNGLTSVKVENLGKKKPKGVVSE
jgi:rare lipoprotein A